MSKPSKLEILEVAECLDLLGKACIGRVAVTDRALPAILPVNFRMHDGTIVLRTSLGSTLSTSMRKSVVAFEVDDYDDETNIGWSVMVVGPARLVNNGVEYDSLSSLDLPAWGPDKKDHFVLIGAEIVTGRRITPPEGTSA
ncbi:MAG: pyridoxamine 5'-phosphate oxidase family protein [Stackebrandtia sp.]